jgi:DNA repair protein RadC
MLVTKFAVKCVKEASWEYDALHQVKTPDEVYEFARDVMKINEEPAEIFVAIALNKRNGMIGYHIVSRGSLTSAPVHPRNVFQFLLNCNAAFAIVLHNHPSGSANPSDADIDITKRLREAGEIMGVEILDHVIIGENCWVSLKRMGAF